MKNQIILKMWNRDVIGKKFECKCLLIKYKKNGVNDSMLPYEWILSLYYNERDVFNMYNYCISM